MGLFKEWAARQIDYRFWTVKRRFFEAIGSQPDEDATWAAVQKAMDSISDPKARKVLLAAFAGPNSDFMDRLSQYLDSHGADASGLVNFLTREADQPYLKWADNAYKAHAPREIDYSYKKPAEEEYPSPTAGHVMDYADKATLQMPWNYAWVKYRDANGVERVRKNPLYKRAAKP